MCGGYRHGVVWGRWRFVNVCANVFCVFFCFKFKAASWFNNHVGMHVWTWRSV